MKIEVSVPNHKDKSVKLEKIQTGQIFEQTNLWYSSGNPKIPLPRKRYIKLQSSMVLDDSGFVITNLKQFDAEKFNILPPGTVFMITSEK